MAFDPDAVKRYAPWQCVSALHTWNALRFESNPNATLESMPQYVNFSDYNQLFALYREAIKKLPTDLERIQASYTSGSQPFANTPLKAKL